MNESATFETAVRKASVGRGFYAGHDARARIFAFHTFPLNRRRYRFAIDVYFVGWSEHHKSRRFRTEAEALAAAHAYLDDLAHPIPQGHSLVRAQHSGRPSDG